MKKLLIIDQDPDTTEVLTDYFTLTGMQVKSISYYNQISQVLDEYKPDAVLCDHLYNGQFILPLLKSHNIKKIIILSSWYHLDSGVSGYPILKKPFDLFELEKMLLL